MIKNQEPSFTRKFSLLLDDSKQSTLIFLIQGTDLCKGPALKVPPSAELTSQQIVSSEGKQNGGFTSPGDSSPAFLDSGASKCTRFLKVLIKMGKSLW